MRETLLRPLGYSREDLDGSKPLIAIVHGFNDLSVGDFHFRELAQYVKEGIREAGGVPAELVVPGMCGETKINSYARRYHFVNREVAALVVEVFVEFNGYDGAVFMCTCDNQVPGYLLGSARTNVPSVFVTGGYMEPAMFEDRWITAFDVAKGFGEFKAGKRSEESLDAMVRTACPTCGACPEIGTANTMCVVAEALGMSLPGNSSTPARSPKMAAYAKEAGKRAVALAKEGVRPSSIISQGAIENAARVVLAVGGSPNAVVHLLALSQELGLDLTLEKWDQLSRTTPFICAVSPNRKGFTMQDLDHDGGIPAVMKEMQPILDGKVLTVTGRFLAENLAKVLGVDFAKPRERGVIRSLADPYSMEGGLAVLKGNLAPDGAIVKQSAVPAKMLKYVGPARVFNSEEEARAALLGDKIKPGDVVVIRGEGPRGCPGSREPVNFMHTLVGMGLLESVGVVTDGRISGTNLGLVISNVCPEAADAGPIAGVSDGDVITIDIPERRLSVEADQVIMENLRKTWQAPKRPVSGALALYARNVAPLCKGARAF
jgi:dihydroxy-acid dehydratase